jgi:putative ABC transport system permease protein
MTAAFSVNLTALSLLALVVGMFLIYNTMTFSVVQRRGLFGTLRCLGVTRQEVFQLVLGEAFLAGLVGTALGLTLGVLMGQGAVRMVTQTINDLFFVLTVRGVQIPPSSLLKGAVLGLGATVLTAAPPAWEAATTPPRTALIRSNLESKAGRLIQLAAWAGFALAAGGLAILVYPTRSLTISFAGTFAAVIGLALITPLATQRLMALAIPVLGGILGSLGRLAPRSVKASLSRTAIAVMALMVSVSVTIGVSLMISSFRGTVIAWLAQTLQGDIYISAPSPAGTTPSAEIDPAILPKARAWPGVARVDTQRSFDVESPAGPIHISATNNFTVPLERKYIEVIGPVENLWERMQTGGILISEPLANRLDLHPGQELALTTAQGLRKFPILGVYYDYASTQGVLLIAQEVYRSRWQDSAITAIALRLSPDTDIDATVQDLQDHLAGGQNLVIRANRTLRRDVLEIFDRTFAITGALQMLATIVAFIGVLSALLSLELERQRERGILRAIGLTLRQMWGLIMLESGLLGAVAGLLAMPTGYILSLILIYIINRRSFGWTLQMQVEPAPFILALLVSTLAALLAGIYPASRLSRSLTADSIRYE